MNKKNIIVVALDAVILLFILLSLIYRTPNYLFMGTIIALIGIMILFSQHSKFSTKQKCWIYIHYFIAVFPIWIVFLTMLLTIL